MCGIVGILSNTKEWKLKKELMQQMLWADTLRGFDSTGIASINIKQEGTIIKKAMTAPDFLQLKTVDKLLTDSDLAWALIGHNRSATR